MMSVLLLSLFSLSVRVTVDVSPQSLTIKRINGQQLISMDGSVPLMETGSPALPIKPVFVSIPQGYSLIDVKVVEADSVSLQIRPSEIFRTEDELYRTAENNSLFSSYMANIVMPVSTWSAFGYRIAVVNFYPLRIDPARDRASLITHIVLELELRETGVNYSVPQVMRRRDFQYVRKVLSELVANPEDLSANAPAPLLVEQAEPHSNIFPYVVITEDGLEGYFEPLTSIFALEGYPAVVRTISWIEARYPGSDRLEKIRNFIRDMFEHHGTVWVLLGADSPFLPSRVVNVPIGTGYYDDVPTDLYFSCLDGTWDRNMNGRYAELEDSVDLLPDVFVGRVTFQDSAEIANVVRKYLAYVSPSDTSYSARALFVGADLFSSGDGASLCEELAGYFPDEFTLIRMYESSSHDNSLTAFIDTVGNGVGIVTMEVHGWYTFINLNSTPRVSFTYNHADTLRNVDKPAVFNIVSCETGGFDRECIVEHMMRAPGGAIAVLSSTRNNYPYVVQPYNIRFYSQLYGNNIREIAALDLLSRSVFVAYAGAHNHSRYALFSYNLMGMPQLRLWSNVPRRTRIIGSPVSLTTGVHDISFRLVDNDGNPLPNKMVSVYKAGETYAIDSTDANGYAHFTVNLQTAGALYIATFDPTLTAAIDTVPVSNSVGVPYLSHYNLIMPDEGVTAGDSVLMQLVLANDGILNYTDVTVEFTDSDTAIDVLVNSISVDTVYRLDTTVVQEPLILRVHEKVTDGYIATVPIRFLRSGQVLGYDTLSFRVNAPQLTIVRTRIEHHAGSQIYKVIPFVGNYGNGEAREVALQLISTPGIRLMDSITFIKSIEADGVQAPDTPLKFLLYAPGPPVRLRVTLTGRNLIGSHTFTISMTEVERPESVNVSTGFAGIKISWSPVDVPALKGYIVYRSTDGSDFQQITPSPILHPEFVDMDVSYGTTYHYYVTAVDTFMTESMPSDTVEGFFYSELDGWPVVVMGPSAPLIADICPYPGKEVIVGSEDGKIYAFHADGTPVDGWPVDVGGKIITSAAAGDLDGDGYDEIVAVPFAGVLDNLKVLDCDGQNLPGWPRTVCGGSWAAPTLYDIDNDGTPEIFVHSTCGKIYAFRADGTPLLSDTTGVFYDLPEYNGGFAEIAIGDINNDGAPEVVTGDRDAGIVALTYYGQMMPGFPVPNTESRTEVILADFLPDEPGLEIATFHGRNLIYLVTSDGRVANGWPVDIGSSNANFYNFSMHVIAADIDNDGIPEILSNMADGIAAYNGDGSPVPGFPYFFHEHMYTEQSPVAADIDGDGSTEAFMVAYYQAYGAASDGSDYGSFPFNVVSGTHKTAAFDDIDGDGAAEMVIPASDGFIHILKMPGSWHFNGWPQYQHDPQKTGFYGFSVRQISGSGETRSLPALNIGIRNIIASRSVQFEITAPVGTHLTLKVYSVDGRLVWSEARTAETRNMTIGWQTEGFSNGVYFYELSAGETVKTGRFVVLK